MGRILPIATLALGIAACSSAGAGPSGIDAGQRAQVQGACGRLGLSAAQTQFDDCVITLSRSLASLNQAATIRQSRAQCSQSGLESGSPAFAECVLNRDQAAGR